MANDFNEATHEVAAQGKVKCKDCGGLLEFSPGVQSLKCQYCGTENEIKDSGKAAVQEEQDFVAYLANASAAAETIQVTTVKCGSCGSATTLRPNVTSDSCPFCGTALVLTGGSTSSSI